MYILSKHSIHILRQPLPNHSTHIISSHDFARQTLWAARNRRFFCQEKDHRFPCKDGRRRWKLCWLSSHISIFFLPLTLSADTDKMVLPFKPLTVTFQDLNYLVDMPVVKLS